MKNIFNLSEKETFRKSGRKKMIYRTVLLTVAVVIFVFNSQSALTFDKLSEPDCGFDEHAHHQGCYQPVLVCGLTEGEPEEESNKPAIVDYSMTAEDFIVIKDNMNTRKDSFTGEEDPLTDPINPDNPGHRENINTAEEQEITAPKSHIHTDGCYENKLVCQSAEHTHTEDCYLFSSDQSVNSIPISASSSVPDDVDVNVDQNANQDGLNELVGEERSVVREKGCVQTKYNGEDWLEWTVSFDIPAEMYAQPLWLDDFGENVEEILNIDFSGQFEIEALDNNGNPVDFIYSIFDINNPSFLQPREGGAFWTLFFTDELDKLTGEENFDRHLAEALSFSPFESDTTVVVVYHTRVCEAKEDKIDDEKDEIPLIDLEFVAKDIMIEGTKIVTGDNAPENVTFTFTLTQVENGAGKIYENQENIITETTTVTTDENGPKNYTYSFPLIKGLGAGTYYFKIEEESDPSLIAEGWIYDFSPSIITVEINAAGMVAITDENGNSVDGPDTITFTNEYSPPVHEMMMFSAAAANAPVVYGFELKKFCQNDGEIFGAPLPGAVFTLYTSEDDGKTLVPFNPEKTATSNSYGTVGFVVDKAGIYYMKETIPSLGYLLDTATYKINIFDVPNGVDYTIERKMNSDSAWNVLEYYVFEERISVLTNSAQADVDGVTFSLYDRSDVLIAETMSYNGGYVSFIGFKASPSLQIYHYSVGSSAKKYTMHMDIGKSYTTNTMVYSYLLYGEYIDDGDIKGKNPITKKLKHGVINNQAEFEFVKTDDNNTVTNYLAEAEFTLYTSENDGKNLTLFAGPVVSGSNGAVKFTHLPVGLTGASYYMKETKAPYGYVLDPTIIYKIIINIDGSYSIYYSVIDGQGNITWSVIDEKDSGRYMIRNKPFEFKKTDHNGELAADTNYLKDAEFTLYSSMADAQNGNTYLETAKSGADGIVRFGNLGNHIKNAVASGGYYYIYMKETTPPENYKPNDTIYRIKISAEGIYTIQWYDKDAAGVSEEEKWKPLSDIDVIKNYPDERPKLPETTGRNTTVYTALGTMMMCFAAGAFFYNKKKLAVESKIYNIK